MGHYEELLCTCLCFHVCAVELGVHVNVHVTCTMTCVTFVLQRGGDLSGMGDLRLVERLSVLISGGPKKEVC